MPLANVRKQRSFALPARARSLSLRRVSELPLLYADADLRAELEARLPRAVWEASFEFRAETAEPEEGFRLRKTDGGWELEVLDGSGWKPLRIDFRKGPLAVRRERSPVMHEPLRDLLQGQGPALAKQAPRVWDGTLGLGEDSFLMASWGCEVVSFERNPLLFFLVDRALAAYRADAAAPPLKWELRFGDVRSHFDASLDVARRPEIIYLDPMYPDRKKAALGTKELRVVKGVVGNAPVGEENDLVARAMSFATKKVLLKRPLHAETLVVEGRAPQAKLGRSTRWDIYAARSRP